MDGAKETIGERFILKPGRHELTVFFSADGFDEAAARQFVESVVTEQGIADVDVAIEQTDAEGWRCVVRVADISFLGAERLAAQLWAGETGLTVVAPVTIADVALRQHNTAILERLEPMRPPAHRDLGGRAVVAADHSQQSAV